MQGLTERQERIIGFLRTYMRDHGYPPTMREIGGHFGFTWPAAKGHLAAIEKKGFIRMNPFKSRGIELLGTKRKESLEIPVAGRIRAGRPLLAVEEIEDHIAVDKGLFKSADAFALKITGDSMIEAGIFDGDYVIVNPQREIKTGEIGVMLIGEEATVKKVTMGKNSVTLVPANSRMEPVTYRPGEVKVLGKVIGVIRELA